jgi:hypothetical protein
VVIANTLSKKFALLVIVSSLLVIASSIASAASVIVDPSSQTADMGDTITVDVRIEDVQGLFGFQFDLRFDSDIIDFDGMEEGDFLKSASSSTFCTTPNTGLSEISNIACTSLGESASGSGILYTFQFRVVGEGTAQVELGGLKLSDSSANQIDSSKRDGTVIVGGGDPPAECGNNVQEGSEECDGTDLNGQTCNDRGFDGGALKCTDCQFDTSDCTTQQTPPTQTCTSQGFICCSSCQSGPQPSLDSTCPSGHVCCLSCAGAPQPGQTVVYAPSATVHLGQRISVPVSIKGVEDLYGFQISLEYDAEIVRFEGISSGEFLRDGSSDIYCTEPTSAGEGRIEDYACTMLGDASGASGEGALLYVQFKGAAAGTSPLDITAITLSDSQGNEIPASTDDGEVEVKTGIPPDKSVEKIKDRIKRLLERLKKLLRRTGMSEDEIEDIITDIQDIPGQPQTHSDCGPADKNRDGTVSIHELRSYRELWKRGTVSEDEFRQAMEEWREQEC